MTRGKTGAGQTINLDHIGIHYTVLSMLAVVAVALFINSADGLLHAASWYLDEYKQWTVLVGIDVFLIAALLANLVMRRRQARFAAFLTFVLSLALVAYSSVTNWLYVESTIGTDTPIGLWSASSKAAAPWLLMACLEVAAVVLSAKNNRENSPLNKAKRDLKAARADVRALKKQMRVAPQEEVQA